jgi:hypothetical protein
MQLYSLLVLSALSDVATGSELPLGHKCASPLWRGHINVINLLIVTPFIIG